jgi:hypothetical protein
MERLNVQQALQELFRRACVTALRLQPCDAQTLVVDEAAASPDVLFDLSEVPPKYVGIHERIPSPFATATLVVLQYSSLRWRQERTVRTMTAPSMEVLRMKIAAADRKAIAE